ncbi:hypothetical protein H0H87_007238 [Tephrocybe sp. NHM501043]|nr:hypothetical protein H0H87_007238 [Tephrocybe sp. NHM501043]
MPLQRFNSGDDLSLRHLPDTSDGSFSFQIPNGNDCLLVEDDMSFFRDTKDDDDVPTTITASSSDKPFTLDELTPRPAYKRDTGVHHSSLPIPVFPALSSQAEPEAKAKAKAKAIAPARHLGSHMTQTKQTAQPDCKDMTRSTGASSEMKSSATAKLEALRAEVEMLNNDAGSSKSAPQIEAPDSNLDEEPRLPTGRRERPISKAKQTVISGGIAKSRSRRPTSSATTLLRNVASAPAPQQQPLLPSQTRVLSENADFLQGDNPDTSICSTAPGGVAERLVMYSQTLLTSFGTLRLSRSDNLATSGSSAKGHGEAGTSGSMDMPRRQERIVLPPVNSTKSVEFKFQVDARLEARKAGEKETLLASQKSRKQNYHQVPDFKTIHAAEEARLALRKENIVPVVPLPFQLTTDERAREREKFEEHLREKERELERANEEKRREKEENEAREIKELRKKAVPRAHEVPEWYKDVPKRKNKELNSSSKD